MQLFTTLRPLSALFLLAALALPGAGEFPVAERVELERVVDGDTLAVRRAGKSVRLRLLCLDTEERFHPGQPGSSGKPQTVFGEETALWAEAYFAGLAQGPGAPHLGLCFPGGREERDLYGRLLCHVVLPDGRDYELELVRAGRSPYFNKYGNSVVAHAEFVAAQAEAQRRKLGIWNPATNQPKTPGMPSAKRDYARLLPWWNARAEAVDAFRKRRAAGEPGLVEATDEAALERLVGREVEVFGEPAGGSRGSLEVAFAPRLRLIVPEGARAQLLALGREYHQNYAYARGRLERAGKGFELRLERPEALHRAGPEPALAR